MMGEETVGKSVAVGTPPVLAEREPGQRQGEPGPTQHSLEVTSTVALRILNRASGYMFFSKQVLRGATKAQRLLVSPSNIQESEVE